MKKWICALVGMICCIWCSFSVRADVIFEPEDAFYQKHAEDCAYVRRLFTANGPDGKVFLYKSPEIPEVVATWENGHRAWIDFTYEDRDGILWGVYDNSNGVVGWMPMEYMEVVYDSISFREEHEDSIVGEWGTLEGNYHGETIFLWKYPGSEDYDTMTVSDYAPEYGSVYTDENGNRWGCVGYYFGHRDRWVCIDQPTADFGQLYPEGLPEELETDGKGAQDMGADETANSQSGAKSHGTKRIVPKMNQGTVGLVVVLVAAVTAATAALLVILKRRGDR